MSNTLSDRIWSRIEVKGPDKCWPWKGGTSKNGYGVFKGPDGRSTSSHRILYWLENGEIPSGYVIAHSCDNPPCHNPKHLIAMTQADNLRDMVNKGRAARGLRMNHPPQKGSMNHAAKITEEIVREIKRLYKKGIKQTEIARKLNVTKANVWAIVHKVSWSHIEG